MKFLNLTVMLLLLGCLMFFMIGCNSNQEAIQQVLDKDKEYGLNSEEAVDIYQKMKSIPLDNCPVDFQIAYRDHVRAWKKAADFEERYSVGNVIIEGFFRGLLGDVFGLSNEIYREAERISKDIKDTYLECLSIARKHGVDTSPYE